MSCSMRGRIGKSLMLVTVYDAVAASNVCSTRITKVFIIVISDNCGVFRIYVLSYSTRGRIEIYLYTELQDKIATATHYRSKRTRFMYTIVVS